MVLLRVMRSYIRKMRILSLSSDLLIIDAAPRSPISEALGASSFPIPRGHLRST